jgi:hypothetical protein
MTFNKIINRIKSYLIAFFFGLRSADKKVFGPLDTSANAEGYSVNQEDKKDNVFQHLLRGEVTQEVRALRHEMYYIERESHKYKLKDANTGEGTKKNDIFSQDLNLEKSDGYPIQLVQENFEVPKRLDESMNKHDLEARFSTNKNLDREYTIKIERDFTPKFRLEEYADKIVVKKIDDTHALLDIYSTIYEKQFSRVHRAFLNMLELQYQGTLDPDLTDFKRVSFTTNKAFGSPDLVNYAYKNVVFENIEEFDGFYVLKYYAEIECDGDDLISEFYDAETAKKFEQHAPRKDNKADFMLEKKNLS